VFVAPLARAEVIDRLSTTAVDVVVIGGGITGAGVAWDAITRGYRVAVVERDDLAAGTSSKSSKLVHGGMRYLATGDVAMVAEGVRERERLRRLAPHLVRPLSFVVPTASAKDRAMMQAALLIYDTIGLMGGAHTHRRLRAQEVYALAGIETGASHGGFRYYDAQTDDARLTLEVFQQARAHGALVLNHASAVDLLVSGERVRGVEVVDGPTQATFRIQARWVVDATGVWAGRVAREHGIAAASIAPAKGVHLTFRASDLPIHTAVVLPSRARDGRRVFLIPWGRQVYVGTTDTPYDGSVDDPSVSEQDAAYLLDAVNGAFGTGLGPGDAIGAWAGLRPLIEGAGHTRDLSRRHLVVEAPDGLVTVTGGKLTTFRQMGQDVVDHIGRADGLRTRSQTTRAPLGAAGRALDGLARTRRALAALDMDQELAGSLFHRHGDLAPVVAARAAAAGEADRLVPDLPYLVGEVRRAVRDEMALTLDDVLQRRLRVSIRHAAAGGDAIGVAAAIAADELGWDDTEQQRQIEDYLGRVRAERGAVPLAD
jgi:glycerol-3-phosphate dehydrogenase